MTEAVTGSTGDETFDFFKNVYLGDPGRRVLPSTLYNGIWAVSGAIVLPFLYKKGKTYMASRNNAPRPGKHVRDVNPAFQLEVTS